jgi:hypothetical protein
LHKTDCKHYYNKIDEWPKVNGYTGKLVENPHCRINKMDAGKCRKDCKWFEV